MGFISKQFIEIIQWMETDADTLSYRFPMEDMEIMTGGRLVVRESQIAVFINEGRLADVFRPGTYRLSTNTLPILTDLNNWDKRFRSPFKSEVYFFSTRLQLDQRWGTTNPIVFREQEFGAIRLRGHGIYSYRVSDARLFHTKISGTRAEFTVEELGGQLRKSLLAIVAETISQSNLSLIDLAANQLELGSAIHLKGKPIFEALGLELETFVIESLALPDDLQQRLDERIGIRIVGDLDRYTKFQIAKSIPVAAANEGSSGAAIGAGLGIGISMAQQISQTIRDSSSDSPQKLKYCVQCGIPMSSRAKYCPDCGQNQQAGA